jgi:hypothetical protein
MLRVIDVVNNNEISETVLEEISSNDELRKDLVRYFREYISLLPY